MGNSLLDFVMALVRDPATAARYAADPAGTLADAHLADPNLTGVTIADVNSLIPVVTDSLSATTPGFGDAAAAANVWTSGAAAAAFDAFDIHIPGLGAEPDAAPPAPAVTPPSPAPSEHPGTQSAAQLPGLTPPDDATVPSGFEPVGPDFVDDAGWHDPALGPQSEQHPGDPGFDFF
ncbi:Rv0340 family IniB-related protein [Mycolicibacterium sp.]|uniref:Rv0340 family IniB-related protein n=1 Tax=Mycolicibacterium sp. TaxID=2320850 RepID=UPI0028B12CC9|nr:Rv0340 family IniB-related protein [Mycolicibacterium sp.]